MLGGSPVSASCVTSVAMWMPLISSQTFCRSSAPVLIALVLLVARLVYSRFCADKRAREDGSCGCVRAGAASVCPAPAALLGHRHGQIHHPDRRRRADED